MKIKKNDICLALAILAISLSFFGWQRYNYGEMPGYSRVIVEREGEIIGDYPLANEGRLVFTDGRGKRNVLAIRNGQASMEEADCPDKLCVKHKPIGRNGESIICLPNKLVIRIEGREEEEVDVILR